MLRRGLIPGGFPVFHLLYGHGKKMAMCNELSTEPELKSVVFAQCM